MKRKLLIAAIMSMMLSVTACSESENINSDKPAEDVNEVAAPAEESHENDEDAPADESGKGGNEYKDKDGNTFYYSVNYVPDWWDGKVEVVESTRGIKNLLPYIEDPDLVTIFSKDTVQRLTNDQEVYKNGKIRDRYQNATLKRFVPEGWVIDYSKSTTFSKILHNSELDINIEIHLNGLEDPDMYYYDYSKKAFSWSRRSPEGYDLYYDKPDDVEYTVQTYVQYKGLSEDGREHYFYVRTYPDGRVYYDMAQRHNEKRSIASISEEDALKMNSSELYRSAYHKVAGSLRSDLSQGEKELEYAAFSFLYWDERNYLDPSSEYYWNK